MPSSCRQPIGSFIPITLEQLARERGVLQSDKSTPCRAGFSVPGPPLSKYTSLVQSRAPLDTEQCVVYVLGAEINTASFAMYTFSISVLLQALLIISMSGAADHGRSRKQLLLAFAFVGATATMLFLPVVPKVFLLGALLAIVANTCFGASFVLLNSFLPVLVRRHPTVQHARSLQSREPRYTTGICDAEEAEPALVVEDDTIADEVVDYTAALLPDTGSDLDTLNRRSRAIPSPELQLSTKISSYGIGIGTYVSPLLLVLSASPIILSLIVVRQTLSRSSTGSRNYCM